MLRFIKKYILLCFFRNAVALCFFVLFCILPVKLEAQEISAVFDGSILIGGDTRACGTEIGGSMRLASGQLEFCNGTDWITPGSASSLPDCTDDVSSDCLLVSDRASNDADLVASNIKMGVNILNVTGTLAIGCTPNTITFSDLTGQSQNTFVESNAQTITNLGKSNCYIALGTQYGGSIIINDVDTQQAAAQISNGDVIKLRMKTAPSAATTVSGYVVTDGQIIDTWTVQTN